MTSQSADDKIRPQPAPEPDSGEHDHEHAETAGSAGDDRERPHDPAHAQGAEPDHSHDHGRGDDGHDLRHEATVEKAGARVSMRITVPADAVASHVDEVARIFRQRAKLQGFRRGKAPMEIIRQRFKDEIREQVLDHLIPEHIGTEIRSRSLRPINNPVLEGVELAPGEPLEFRVSFDVAPEIEITGYKDLAATRTLSPVTDEAVDKAIGGLRERAAKLESVDADEGAQAGDYVRATIALFPRDGKGKKLAEEDRYVHVGQEKAVPSLNSQLEGLAVGATREFITELGDSYPNDLLAGKEVSCRLRVSEIKRRHLPAIDDELARDFGLADLEELRAKTREDLARHLEEEADEEVARQLLDQVLAANPTDTPQSLVEARLDRSVQRAAQELARQGIDPRHSIDWSAFRAENRPHAERAVIEEILLDEIAAAEGLVVEDAEVLAEIESHQEGQPKGHAAALAQSMRKDGSFEGLRAAMRRRRALDFVRDHARIHGVDAAPDATSDSPA